MWVLKVIYWSRDILVDTFWVFISRSTIQCLLIWLFDGTELDRSDYGVQRHVKNFYGKFFLYINIFIHYIIYVWEKKLTVNCISFDDIKYTCKKHMVKGTQLFISIRWPFAIGLCCCPSSTNNFTFLISENYVANSFHF